MSPKTILHVVLSMGPGGMENGIVNVATRLDPARWRVHICCLETEGEFAKRLPNEVKLSVLNKKAGYSPSTVWKLAQLIKKIQPSIIHTHNFGPLFYGALAGIFSRGIPLLHGEHGMLHANERTRFYMSLRKWLFSRCRKVHTVSHTLKQYFVDLGFSESNICSLLNGVDTERFRVGNRKSARRAIGLPEEGFYLGMLSSLQRRKRHREVIEGFQLIAEQHPQARLLIVGSGGPEETRIRNQIVASPVRNRIHLFDFQADPRSFYQSMDLLLVASNNEGLSNAALESMACGVPVLAGDACGNSEIIRHGEDGLLMPMATGREVAESLTKCLSMKEQVQQMGNTARQKVQKEFSLNAMVERYDNLYSKLTET